MGDEPLVILVRRVSAARLRLTRSPDGGLAIRGPRSRADLAAQLRARQADVVLLFDWSHARLDEPKPCVICRRPALRPRCRARLRPGAR